MNIWHTITVLHFGIGIAVSYFMFPIVSEAIEIVTHNGIVYETFSQDEMFNEDINMFITMSQWVCWFGLMLFGLCPVLNIMTLCSYLMRKDIILEQLVNSIENSFVEKYNKNN